MPIINDLFSKYPNEVFIESGTLIGDGVKKAIEAGFSKIYSIEAQKEYFEYSSDLFVKNNDVLIVYSESHKVILEILNYMNEQATIWLDAHYSGMFWIEGKEVLTYENDCPLLKELEEIGKHHIKTHTILIDDMRLYGHLPIIPALKKINPDYKISYADGYVPNDILIATV